MRRSVAFRSPIPILYDQESYRPAANRWHTKWYINVSQIYTLNLCLQFPLWQYTCKWEAHGPQCSLELKFISSKMIILYTCNYKQYRLLNNLGKPFFHSLSWQHYHTSMKSCKIILLALKHSTIAMTWILRVNVTHSCDILPFRINNENDLS